MVGDFEDQEYKGIIPRSFDYLFEKIKQLQGKEKNKYIVSIAFIQIYLELIQDLFNSKSEIKIRGDKETGVYLENATWIRVKSTNECKEAFIKGEKNRNTECTRMNAHSSRSHALLIAKIEKTFNDKQNKDHVITRGMLYLVDLAGSERVHKTKAQEERLEEAKKINFSLLTLGNCINALIDPKTTHIPYRNSKLTRILQDSLGGNAKTSLIVNISPSTYNTEETISSLNFGLRAMSVQNKPMINEAEDFQAQCQQLQEDYDKLAEEYNKLKSVYEEVVEENEKFKNGETYLELQKKSIQSHMRESSSKNITKSREELNTELEQKEEEMEKYMKFAEHTIKEKELEIEKATKEARIIINKKDKKIEYLNNQVKQFHEEYLKSQEECIEKSKDLEDLQLSINNIQQQKEDLEKALILETKKQKEETDKLKKKIKELENKSLNTKTKSSQTETILNQQLKDALMKLNISQENITSANYENIINELIITTETALVDISKQSGQSKKYIEMLQEKSERINALQEENKTISYQLEEQFTQIKSLENSLKQLEKENKDLEISSRQYKQQYDLKMSETNTSKVNYANMEMDLKKLQQEYTMSEKILKKNLTSQSKDNVFINKYIKDIKKVELLLEKDSLQISNKKDLEQFSNKLEKKLKNIQSSLEDYINNNSDNGINSIKSSSKLLADKIEEQFNENKKITFNIINSYMKLCELLCNYYKNNFKIRAINSDESEINSLELNYCQKGEQFFRNGLLSLIENTINNFATYCPNNNVDDLKRVLNKQKNKINLSELSNFLETSFKIVDKLINRIVSTKTESELEIQNLNEKLIYFMRELSLYKDNKKSFQSSNRNKSPCNFGGSKDISEDIRKLKEEEIAKLRKDIDKYLSIIKEMSVELEMLKSNKQFIMQVKEEYWEEPEIDVKGNSSRCKKEMDEIGVELNALKQQKLNEEIQEENRKKNNYFKERLKKHLNKEKK